jgi:hypothetical protein
MSIAARLKLSFAMFCGIAYERTSLIPQVWTGEVCAGASEYRPCPDILILILSTTYSEKQ